MFKNLLPWTIRLQASFQETLDLAKAAGYGGVDASLGDARGLADENSVEYVKGLLDDAGLKIGGWSLPVNWRGDDAEYYGHLSRLPERAEFAADLGCLRAFTVVIGGDNNRHFRENWDFHVKRLQPVAEILKDYGHSLGIEFVGPLKSRAPLKHGFIYTMDAMLGLCAAIGTGNVGLLFDAWHCYASHATLDDMRKLTKEDIVYVHVNDAPEGIEVDDQIDSVRAIPCETGVIPLAEILGILKDIGYDGPVTPEPFSEKIAKMSPEDGARAMREGLDRAWKEAGLS